MISPWPGPLRLGSFAWKCVRCFFDSFMICGMGSVSWLIALTSRCSVHAGLSTALMSLIVSCAVVRKLVSFCPSGSRAMVMPSGSATSAICLNIFVALSNASW